MASSVSSAASVAPSTVEAGRSTRAERLLEQAITGYEDGFARNVALYRVHLAAARVQAGAVAHYRDHAVLAWHYEHLATEILEWAPTLIPDLLRTPAHDLDLLNHPFADTDHADAQSLAEPTRRNDLADQNRRYTFFVGDTALRACPPQLRADQLDYLKHWAAQANITVRVVPADVCPPGVISPFTLYGDREITLAAAVHHHRASTYLADRDTLAAYLRATQKLRRHAFDLQYVEETPLSTLAGPTDSPDAAEAS